MKLALSHSIPRNALSILFVCEKETAPSGLPQQKNLVGLAKADGFKAKLGNVSVLHPRSGSPARAVLLAGLGERSKVTPEILRRASASAVKKAKCLSQTSVSILMPAVLNDAKEEACAVAEGALLGNYVFKKYKSPDKDSVLLKNAVLVAPKDRAEEAKKGVRLAQILSEAASLVRDLVNEPPSRLSPSKMVQIAEEVAEKGKSAGVAISVLDKDAMQELGMEAILGVNRGSAEPPAIVHFHYRPVNIPAEEKLRSVAFVGKGITFDSGGLSLKPAASMEDMKMDMAGAATVLGIFKAIPQIKPKMEIHGILALTENMPGGRAYKPGDVLKAMNGKTIEVLNTDAEGRVVLADALFYTAQKKPDAIIDIATLTGACITALGSLVAGVMGNNDDLIAGIEKAGKASGEMFCRLPLVDEYRDRIKSKVADLRNTSSVRGEAGAIIGGLFLEEFVDERPWAHIDIAGPAWSEKDFYTLASGGTGFPVRTLIRYLLSD